MVHVIALVAKAGHGKTTTANYLRDRHGARIVSLATPLKRCSQKVMRFSDAQLWGTQEEKEAIDPRYGFSAREFLQLLGTEGMREEFGADIHLNTLIRRVEDADAESDVNHVYVVDDCRFLNESEFFGAQPHEDFHSALIKITCTDAPVTTPIHRSETDVDLVPDEWLSAHLVSSRAAGMEDLFSKIDQGIAALPKLAPFRRVFAAYERTGTTTSRHTAEGCSL